MTVPELQDVPFLATADRMITAGELCELVGGRVPLIVEIKSRFDGDHRLVTRVANVLRAYKGPIAAMSFDPVLVTALRRLAPTLTRGIVAERRFQSPASSLPSSWEPFRLGNLLHAPRSWPQFVAYRIGDLPAAAPALARKLGLPLLTWTVRTPEERARAAHHADQMIFEGFRP
jgi:glycerophosphoryl diester phosphodiesterase